MINPTASLTSSPPRIGKLDAVRGIAAMIVLVAHCGGLPLAGLEQSPSYWWLSVLWDSGGAVMIFFLLSGYVLALQLNSPSRPTYRNFLVRRFFRIWPVFIVTVTLSFLTFRWTNTLVDPGIKLAQPRMPTIDNLIENFLMVGSPFTIVPPAWSLYVEVRMSAAFPAMLALARKIGFAWTAVISGVLSVALTRLVHLPLPDFITSLAEASRYMILFVIGANLATPGNLLEKLYLKTPFWLKTLTLFLAFGLLACKFYPFTSDFHYRGYAAWPAYVLLFVFCLYSRKVEKLILLEPFGFFGRISYPLYLVHVPVLALARPHVPQPLVLMSVLTLSVVIAWILTVFVEQPFMSLGRRLTSPKKRLEDNCSQLTAFSRDH